MFRRALIEIVRAAARAAEAFASTSAFTPPAKQHRVVGDDFCHVLLLIRLLVVPRARLESAFDVNLAALLQVLACNLGQALPQHHVVPLGPILPLAALVLVPFVGGDREARNRSTLWCVLHF